MRQVSLKRKQLVTGYAEFTRTNLPSPSTKNIVVVSQYDSVGLNHPGPPYKEPGPWKQTTDETISPSTQVTKTSGSVRGDGTVLVSQWPAAVTRLSIPSGLSDSEERSLGTRLMNQARPTNPTSDMMVALLELRRDGIPDLPGVQTWRSRTLSAKNAGSEYLNIEFGWRPLVSDVRKFLRATIESEKILKTFRNQSNHWIPASSSLPIQSSTKYDEGFTSPLAPALANMSWTGSTFQSVKKEVWFKAQYKFWLPLGDDLASRMARYALYARKLYGIRMTPEVLWETAPWSWAVDWFVDVGSIMESASNFGPDSAVARNACLMWRTSWTADLIGVETYSGKGVSSKMTIHSQNRRLATPWGFMVNGLNALNARQFAIMGALGLTGLHDIPLTAR